MGYDGADKVLDPYQTGEQLGGSLVDNGNKTFSWNNSVVNIQRSKIKQKIKRKWNYYKYDVKNFKFHFPINCAFITKLCKNIYYTFQKHLK